MNPLLDYYNEQAKHQQEHMADLWLGNPWLNCMSCPIDSWKKTYKHPQTKWAWAVPDDGALDLIQQHTDRGVVEIGAGTGYWANLLSIRGVDVVAYDENPPSLTSDKNHWHPKTEQFHEVKEGNQWSVLDHQDRTLFLCWPFMNEMAVDTLKLYEGEVLVYVGEMRDFSCATDEFFEMLEGWKLHKEYQHPQWWGLHDYMTIWTR